MFVLTTELWPLLVFQSEWAGPSGWLEPGGSLHEAGSGRGEIVVSIGTSLSYYRTSGGWKVDSAGDDYPHPSVRSSLREVGLEKGSAHYWRTGEGEVVGARAT